MKMVLAEMQSNLKENAQGKGSKVKATRHVKKDVKDVKRVSKDVKREVKDVKREVKDVQGEVNVAESLAKKASMEEIFSPPPKLRKTGSEVDSEFVEQSWTPSPGPKQMTLGASLQRCGQHFPKIVKQTSPGAKKPESLKDTLMKEV